MSIAITAVKLILNLIFAVMKLFPVKDRVSLISRQSDKPSVDFLMLQKEIKSQSPTTDVRVLCHKLDGMPGIGYIPVLLGQMAAIASSKAVVIDTYCIAVSLLKQRKETEIIQIWHALGALKRFGRSIAGNRGEGRSLRLARVMNMHGNYSHVLCSSRNCFAAYEEAFGYDESCMLEGSLPRVDLLMSACYRTETAAKIAAKYPQIDRAPGEGRKVVVYAPTFRMKGDIGGALEALKNEMSGTGNILVIKPHPLMNVKAENSRRFIVDTDFSTMEMLFAADVVICDYSAIVFEAALLTKPVCFYAFDLDTYAGSRSFYLDYEKDMPGEVCRTASEVKNAVERDDFDLERVKTFADRYVTCREGATGRLVSFILQTGK